MFTKLSRFLTILDGIVKLSVTNISLIINLNVFLVYTGDTPNGISLV